MPKEIEEVFIDYLLLLTELFRSHWVKYDTDSGIEQVDALSRVMPAQIIGALKADELSPFGHGHGATWYPVDSSSVGAGSQEVEGCSFDSWVSSLGYKLRGIPFFISPESFKS